MAKILKETGLEELISLIKAAIKANVADITNIEGDITSIENNITNIENKFDDYATKEDTYTKDEVDALVDALPKMKVEVVDTLPTGDDINPETIYLLPKENGKNGNVYEEYFYSNGNWELIGDTEVDLSNYYTKDETYSKDEIDEMLEEITAAEVLAMWNAADGQSS